ncbi:MAG TPA: hypothetical protein VFY60_03100 [Pyrinomonadaceae bacterium]|nr:hypothetical protein [Pyrinomonadaceae bacterium]
MNADIDKQQMRAYLLGTLDADRCTQLEERLLREPEVYEELLAAKEELIDEHVAGNLSELDQRQFDKHLAITAEGRQKIRFATLLKRYAASHPAPPVVAVGNAQTTAPARRRFSFFLPFMRRPVFASGAVLVVGLAILTICWIMAQKTAEQQAFEQSGLQVIEATLSPRLTRSGGKTNRVTVPPEGPFKVELRLELTNASFNNYKSQLFRESKSLLTKVDLKMEARGAQQVVPVVIAGEFLSPGDYELTLSGVLDSGADEFIDNYYFRVTTE